MTYDLYIGDRTFSSWSLRGWLMLENFDIPFRTHLVGLYAGTMKEDLAPLVPARLVPVMRMADGTVVGDTLAMAETLAERHPDAGLWPSDPAQRATARWMAAEMHSGFSDLRTDCPMQLIGRLTKFNPSNNVKSDLERIEVLWDMGLRASDGPWLFGDYSLADVFFAPVAARIAGFGLPVSKRAQTYVDAHLADPAFRRWRALGLTKTYDQVPYIDGQAIAEWPGPTPRKAVLSDGPSMNATCRDKTVNDPEAWPAFMKMVADHQG